MDKEIYDFELIVDSEIVNPIDVCILFAKPTKHANLSIFDHICEILMVNHFNLAITGRYFSSYVYHQQCLYIITGSQSIQ